MQSFFFVGIYLDDSFTLTSIRNLVDAASHFGLKAVAMKIPIKELLKVKRPVIAHVKRDSDVPNHFVVIEIIGESIYISGKFFVTFFHEKVSI